jgi:two-component system chemotaxis sensor kinase CheA
LILAALDRIKEILAGLEETQEEPVGDDTEIKNKLNAMAEGKVAPDSVPEPVVVAPVLAVSEPLDEAPMVSSLGNIPGDVSLEELEAAFAAAPGPNDDLSSSDTAMDQDSESLFDRIGGLDTVKVVTHLFHNRMLGDAVTKDIFAGTDLRVSKAAITQFFTVSFTSGKCEESEIAGAFAPFIAKNCTIEQFEATAIHLKSVLEEVDISSIISGEVYNIYVGAREVVTKNSIQTASIDKTKKQKDNSAKKAAESNLANQSIRVNVGVLEELMTMVSELVLTRNQLMQIARNTGESDFTVPLQRLSQCTTELQEGVMKTRMQPIGNAWSKLPRIVRDLTMDLGKKIDLQMLGQDTELDRQVLELIKDPLTHMVRNSADHGIETPEKRLVAGKKETGTIRLNAFHEGGHIIIEITDDGAGLPVQKLKEKALNLGLATAEELDEMSDNQIQRFIFHAGFSTAEKVTSVSGRGVGMDVVRSNIEKIGGTVDLKSIEGKGTSFAIKIPLTLAIVSALIVQCDEQRFAIPQISVLELVRACPDTDHSIEYVNGTPVLRLRDRLLPLTSLRNILGFEEEENKKEDFIIVTQVGNFTFGIIVDQVYDTEEIVVKPVAPIIKGMNIYSGNTILGDGSVIMILDANGLAQEISAKSDSSAGTDFGSDEEDESAAAIETEKEAILTFRAGGSAPKAVPLSLVARLEEIEVKDMEYSDGQPVVQYRGQLMPMMTLNDDYKVKEEGRQQVLVFSNAGKTMGLIVEEIIDILEDNINVELVSDTAGVIGSAIINGISSEVIDVAYCLEQLFGTWSTARTDDDEEGIDNRSDILLIDDSTFFLYMVRPILSAAGYKVTAVGSAEEALKLRAKGHTFDVIISDIEMPDMDGFGFAREIKSKGEWTEIPLIALSSSARPEDYDLGRAVGFNDYIEKRDRDSLIKSLAEQIKLKNEAA